jgi:hypothetical protein
VRLEASTKPHVHQKFEIFWTNIAFTMACPMSKNGPKKGLRPLGVNLQPWRVLNSSWQHDHCPSTVALGVEGLGN